MFHTKLNNDGNQIRIQVTSFTFNKTFNSTATFSMYQSLHYFFLEQSTVNLTFVRLKEVLVTFKIGQ
jgi:hypothetical protein